MRKPFFAITALALALAICPAAMADSTVTLGPTSSSYLSTSVSPSNLGTWVTSINGVATPGATVGDPDPFTATYTESVYMGGPDALCATCLNFEFTLTNSATSGTDGIAEHLHHQLRAIYRGHRQPFAVGYRTTWPVGTNPCPARSMCTPSAPSHWRARHWIAMSCSPARHCLHFGHDNLPGRHYR
jgi:hypothetical protein